MQRSGDDAVTHKRKPQVIGVAISGGGHRATAYGLGVLLYLVDAGLNRKVGTITSVSGGSILNAFVALLRSADGAAPRSFRSYSPGEFDVPAAHLAHLLAGSRKVWIVSMAAAIFAAGTAVAATVLWEVDGMASLLALALFLLGISCLIGPKSGGTLWGWWGSWFYCCAIAWILAAGWISGARTEAWGACLSVSVLLSGYLLLQRHRVAEAAFEHAICKPLRPDPRRWITRRTTLEEMGTDVRHVFCATEMHSGQHAYFSHDFVYARGFGLGRPAALPVATAIQVSANFPGGFPIRPLRASRFGFFLTDRFEDAIEKDIQSGRDILMPDEDIAWSHANQEFAPIRPLPDWLMLSDGGVFDNLAVDWFLENKARLARFLMHLNWDYDADHQHWKKAKRSKSVLAPFGDRSDTLIVVNAGITAHWQRSASVAVALPYIGEMIGLSQISGTMYNNYTKGRIAALREHLVLELGFAERLVRTTLLPLGEAVTAQLMQAGYRDAMYAASRRFDQPVFEENSHYFNDLARGKHSARTLMPVERFGQ